MAHFKKKFGTGEHAIELTTETMPVKEQLKLKFRLLNMFADIGGAITKAIMVGKDDKDVSSKEEAEIIMSLIESVKSVDGDLLVDLLVELCEYCNEVGQGKGKVYFDSVLADKPMVMIYEIAIWVLKSNYGNFLKESGLLTRFAALAQKMNGQLS